MTGGKVAMDAVGMEITEDIAGQQGMWRNLQS